MRRVRKADSGTRAEHSLAVDGVEGLCILGKATSGVGTWGISGVGMPCKGVEGVVAALPTAYTIWENLADQGPPPIPHRSYSIRHQTLTCFGKDLDSLLKRRVWALLHILRLPGPRGTTVNMQFSVRSEIPATWNRRQKSRVACKME
jgi:hypothetical protein